MIVPLPTSLHRAIELLESSSLARAAFGDEVGPRITFDSKEKVIATNAFYVRYQPFVRRTLASRRVAYVLRRHTPTSARLEDGLRRLLQATQRESMSV